jgi:hypothetical protein
VRKRAHPRAPTNNKQRIITRLTPHASQTKRGDTTNKQRIITIRVINGWLHVLECGHAPSQAQVVEERHRLVGFVMPKTVALAVFDERRKLLSKSMSCSSRWYSAIALASVVAAATVNGHGAGRRQKIQTHYKIQYKYV